MPDESCRNCGGKLYEHTKCSHCLKTNSMICKNCALCTREQFHSICMLKNTSHTNTVPKIKSGNYSNVVVMA
ncbi:hypothetical protein C6990_04920 [Nitrosopumilus sp. b3]|nr:hypothetical protein C6990_04920 [Nitrosopumilus sp. b3]